MNGKLGWTRPSYAPIYDIPVTGPYLEASKIVDYLKLGERVVLPPNLKKLSETPNLTDHQEVYIAQYRTTAATIEYIRQKQDPVCPTMKKIVKNWKTTCDKLVADPHFGEGWKLPAFFPIYSASCYSAIKQFFDAQKELYPQLAGMLEEQRLHAVEQHEAWEGVFIHVTSLYWVPFPRCVWYQKFFVTQELRRPDIWRRFFEEDNADADTLSLDMK